MAKVTERSLKNQCFFANQGVFRTWAFGLKVERYGNGFMVYKLSRRPGNGESPLFTEPLPAKETYRFIQGFVNAAALANCGEGESNGQS